MTCCPGPNDPAGACGSCCDPVYLSWDPALLVAQWGSAVKANQPDPSTDDGWAKWREWGWTDEQREHAITRWSPESDTTRNADFIAEHWTVREHLEATEGREEGWRVDCAVFDRHRRTCGAYEDRPPICSGYPWYGGRNGPADVDLANVCAYQDDVPGRKVLPLVEVRQGADSRV